MDQVSIIQAVERNMEIASEEGNTLDRTVFYCQEAVCFALLGILGELVKIRQATEDAKRP